MLRLAFFAATFFFHSSNTILLAPSAAFGELPAPFTLPGDSIPAFPEAVGHGAMALESCRNDLTLVVRQVTNTNNSGAGSLRTVLDNTSAGTYDIVIFRTGGTVTLSGEIVGHSSKCLYVAGQTAPGGGFQLTEARWRFDNVDDLVVRYLRHRAKPAGWTWIVVTGGRHIIFDHVTSMWGSADGTGQGINLGPKRGGNMTFSWSIAAEADQAHPTLTEIRAEARSNPQLDSVSVYRNLLFGPSHRAPLTAGKQMTVAQNVVYNWKSRGSEASSEHETQYLNNYHKRGPATGARKPIIIQDGCGGNPASEFWDGVCKRRVYLSGNRSSDNNYETDTPLDDVWRGAKRQIECRDVLDSPQDKNDDFDGFGCDFTGDTVPLAFRLSSPFDTTGRVPLPLPATSDAVRDSIIDFAGASRSLTCQGIWQPNRDVEDTRLHDEFNDSTGSINIDTDTLTAPTLATGPACTDTDGDGMPDAFESLCGADATSLSISGDISGDGYLNMEEYVNGTNSGGVDLAWTDNSGNEAGFYIDRDTGGGFARYDSVAADITIYHDASGIPGYSYRVGAHNTDGESAVAGPVTIACR